MGDKWGKARLLSKGAGFEGFGVEHLTQGGGCVSMHTKPLRPGRRHSMPLQDVHNAPPCSAPATQLTTAKATTTAAEATAQKQQ